jgi:putative flippase GtrA
VKQLARYAVVGIATNLAGYLAYLLITWLGVGPKVAMTCLYLVGASASFLGNRRWTFSHRGHIGRNAVRFALAHGLGYLLNLAILVVFVDHLGLPHQLVQVAAIFAVALFLFALFRLFVFPARSAVAPTSRYPYP